MLNNIAFITNPKIRPKGAHNNLRYSRSKTSSFSALNKTQDEIDVRRDSQFLDHSELFIPFRPTTGIFISKRGLQHDKRPVSTKQKVGAQRKIIDTNSLSKSLNRSKLKIKKEEETPVHNKNPFSNQQVSDAIQQRTLLMGMFDTKTSFNLKLGKPRIKQHKSYFEKILDRKEEYSYLESDSIFKNSLREKHWKEQLKNIREEKFTVPQLDYNFTFERNDSFARLTPEELNQHLDESLRKSSRPRTRGGEVTQSFGKPISLRGSRDESASEENNSVLLFNRYHNPEEPLFQRPPSNQQKLRAQSVQHRRRTQPYNIAELEIKRLSMNRTNKDPPMLPESKGGEVFRRKVSTTKVPGKGQKNIQLVFGENELDPPDTPCFEGGKQGNWFEKSYHAERAKLFSRESEAIQQDLHNEIEKISDDIKKKMKESEYTNQTYPTFSH